jgi:hypothetical protein
MDHFFHATWFLQMGHFQLLVTIQKNVGYPTFDPLIQVIGEGQLYDLPSGKLT